MATSETTLSFRDFKDELLIALVLETNGSTNKQINPAVVATRRNLESRDGWLNQAVRSFNDSGLVKAMFFLNGDIALTITGDGLEQAEELANERGYDIYDEIRQEGSSEDAKEKQAIPASDRIVKIDHNAAEFKDIRERLVQVIDGAESSNSLNGSPDEKAQRIAEVEAGTRLLDAPQVDSGLVQRLLVPALRWIGEKSAEQALGVLVVALLGLIAAFLGFSL